MPVTNRESGTNIEEVANRIYRINTPVNGAVGSFSFNQYLIDDEEPLLFHTGLKQLFPLVREAVEMVLPARNLRFIAFSHFESDECGSLNDWLKIAHRAEPVCSAVGAMTSVGDFAERPPRPLADGERLTLGSKTVRWFDAPHLPHGWDCGYLFDETTKTLFCGDLFTQGGDGALAVTEADILGPSEEFRKPMDYYAHAAQGRALFEKLAEARPATLACMHGSAWRGDGAALLRALSDAVI